MDILTHCRRTLVAVLALSLLGAAAASVAASSVDVSIEPAQIALGDSARLTILTTGSGALSVALPVVPGLEFRVVGQSRQIQIINGATLESTSTIIRVTPEEAGVFTIPGLTPNSPPLLLRVSPTGGGTAPGVHGAAPPGAVPIVPAVPNTGGIRLTPDGSAFVHLEIPKHEIYVGESVPVEIQVGMRDGFVESYGLPKLNSSDFTLNNLSRQPEHAPRTLDSKAFTVYTWRSLLGAVKPGTYSLTFESPLTVRIRTRPQSESMLDDLLGDPFLQNIFGASVQKNITVASPEITITVLPLPPEGKPADFGGAVGSFQISADLSSAKNTAGDPLTLRMHVSGAGNFDRVESSMLGGNAQWKTYEPKATFKASDPIGYRGEKTFEQPIIATQAGTQTIPPLTLDYFDPATRRYETARSAPLNVTVSPAPDMAASEPPLPSAPAAAAAARLHSGLRPDHAVSDSRVASLIPLYFRPPFVWSASGIALLFAGGWAALQRRERLANDIQRERARVRSQLIRGLLEHMSGASLAANAALFLSCARSALQQSLSERWQLAPDLITLDDVDARLQGEEREQIRQIFLLADEANYSGAELKAADFEHWTRVVRNQLAGEQPA